MRYNFVHFDVSENAFRYKATPRFIDRNDAEQIIREASTRSSEWKIVFRWRLILKEDVRKLPDYENLRPINAHAFAPPAHPGYLHYDY